jgi:hypothetical protein
MACFTPLVPLGAKRFLLLSNGRRKAGRQQLRQVDAPDLRQLLEPRPAGEAVGQDGLIATNFVRAHPTAA